MKKIIFKTGVFSLLAFVAGTIIIFSSSCSCSKNSDVVSPAPGSPESQVTTDGVNTQVSSFTVISSDGHAIGINGTKAVTPDKGNANAVGGCGAVSNLKVQAVCSNGVAFLYNGWTSGGGAVIALYINGQPYKDPTTGYGLWLSSVNGLSVPLSISPGQTYRDFVRTYCSNDTANTTYNDSPVTTYIVPSTFVCGGAPPPTTVKGHRK